MALVRRRPRRSRTLSRRLRESTLRRAQTTRRRTLSSRRNGTRKRRSTRSRTYRSRTRARRSSTAAWRFLSARSGIRASGSSARRCRRSLQRCVLLIPFPTCRAFAHSEYRRWASSSHRWRNMHDHGLACLCRTFRHGPSTSSIRTAYCRIPIHVSLDSVIRTSNNVNNAFIAHFYNTSRRAGANTYSSDVCEASSVVYIIHMRAGPIKYAMVARRAPSSRERPYCLCSTLDPLGAELRPLTLGPRVDPETHTACPSVGAQSSPSASPTMA